MGRKLLSQWKQTSSPLSSTQKHKKKKTKKEDEDTVSLSTLSTHSDDVDINTNQAEEESDDDDFGLYKVSIDDLQNSKPKKEETLSQTQSESADLELLSSQSSRGSMESISPRQRSKKHKR